MNKLKRFITWGLIYFIDFMGMAVVVNMAIDEDDVLGPRKENGTAMALNTRAKGFKNINGGGHLYAFNDRLDENGARYSEEAIKKNHENLIKYNNCEQGDDMKYNTKGKVLPCPFCGSKKIKFDRIIAVLKCHGPGCSAQMYHPCLLKAVEWRYYEINNTGKTEEQVQKDIIDLWNKRVGS